MAEIISLATRTSKSYTDAMARICLKRQMRVEVQEEELDLSEFFIYGERMLVPGEEVTAFKGSPTIRVDAIKAILNSIGTGELSQEERIELLQNEEAIRHTLDECFVRLKVW